jgi:hypothetical protein
MYETCGAKQAQKNENAQMEMHQMLREERLQMQEVFFRKLSKVWVLGDCSCSMSPERCGAEACRTTFGSPWSTLLDEQRRTV